MEKLQRVAVIGAGTMGSALAQKFAQESFDVVLADREMRFVEKGLAGIKATLEQGVERRLFKPQQVEAILSRIHGTANLQDLRDRQLIVEAIFEDFQAKSDLFQQLGTIVPAETILATNTSSFSVSGLAANVPHPERFIGLHYFYHAAKNRLVEIVPGDKTSAATSATCRRFAHLAGKDAITCKDVNGFVVNRFFVPWLNESVRLLEEGLATPGEIDAVCMKVFKIGMGPFALMNATGVPIAYHAQKTLEVFGPLYTVAEGLRKQVFDVKTDWQIETCDAKEVAAEKAKTIRERMLGVVFFVCGQILQEEICSAVDLNRGARIGLRWSNGPIDLMARFGLDEVNSLVSKIAARYDVQPPPAFDNRILAMQFVTLEKHGTLATITINKPEDMNALNETVVQQLSGKFDAADADPEIETIVLTGAGKAFVAGADIKFFIDNMRKNDLQKIYDFTAFGQDLFRRIDDSEKNIVAIVNGLALGGGLELALCADKIFATPNAALAFPETGIGIYPGLGGTQRPQRRIGQALTKHLIGTGSMISAQNAADIGLVDGVIAREQAWQIITGKSPIPAAAAKPDLKNHWLEIAAYFSSNTFADVLAGKNDELEAEAFAKLQKMLRRKAPIALHIAEKLIDEKRGPASELDHLKEIFATEDAMTGLNNIGRKVEFQGK